MSGVVSQFFFVLGVEGSEKMPSVPKDNFWKSPSDILAPPLVVRSLCSVIGLKLNKDGTHAAKSFAVHIVQ